MNLGQFTITNSIEMCDQALFSRAGIVILLDDEIRAALSAKDSPDIMSGSVILPPFTIMAQAVDNIVPYAAIETMYFEYLHNREPAQFIAGIIAMLIKGINVFVLLSSHEAEFGFIPNGIVRFFSFRYGITPYTDIDSSVDYTFSWNPTPMYVDQMIEDLFMYDYMEPDALLLSWSDYDLSPEVVTKLIWIYNPATATGSMEEYSAIFNAMKNNAKKQSDVRTLPFLSGGAP